MAMDSELYTVGRKILPFLSRFREISEIVRLPSVAAAILHLTENLSVLRNPYTNSSLVLNRYIPDQPIIFNRFMQEFPDFLSDVHFSQIYILLSYPFLGCGIPAVLLSQGLFPVISSLMMRITNERSPIKMEPNVKRLENKFS